MLEQQDTSEAFAFITETLQLPLLSLQVDLFHHGRRDDDDHKVVYERLLNLAVPPDPENKGIKLEDCLEEYFNTQVDVQRDSEVARKSALDDSSSSSNLQRWNSQARASQQTTSDNTLTASPIESSQSTVLPDIQHASQSDSHAPSQVSFAVQEPPTACRANRESLPRRLSARARSSSVIQNVIIDEKGQSQSVDDYPMLQRGRRKGSTVVKAVTIPAWQFFRLIRESQFSRFFVPTLS